jgi:hypothetical protein
MKESLTTLVGIELRTASPNQSGVTTTLWAQVTVILIQYQIF